MPNASRWDLFINGTATQDGVLEIRFGRDRVLVDILGGQDAAATRDLLAAELRGLGYSVDCFWSEPVRGIKTVSGVEFCLDFEAHGIKRSGWRYDRFLHGTFGGEEGGYRDVFSRSSKGNRPSNGEARPTRIS